MFERARIFATANVVADDVQTKLFEGEVGVFFAVGVTAHNIRPPTERRAPAVEVHQTVRALMAVTFVADSRTGGRNSKQQRQASGRGKLAIIG